MPRWRLYKGPTGNTPVSPIASAIDSSVDVLAYETVHTISASFAEVSASGSFWLEFDDEAGGVGMTLIDIYATVVQ